MTERFADFMVRLSLVFLALIFFGLVLLVFGRPW